MEKERISAEDFQWAGKEVAKGAAQYAAKLLVLGCLLAWLAISALNFSGHGVDDSDFSAWKRSGFRVHTDAKTGVQYVSGPNGGITPRINRNGEILVR